MFLPRQKNTQKKGPHTHVYDPLQNLIVINELFYYEATEIYISGA